VVAASPAPTPTSTPAATPRPSVAPTPKPTPAYRATYRIKYGDTLSGIAATFHTTVLAIEHDGAGIYNIVDDEPAPSREWLPALADALGAKPPRHIPAGLVRVILGEDVVMGQTQARGASNAKAKRELGWTLRYPSWREGFVAAYATTATNDHKARQA